MVIKKKDGGDKIYLIHYYNPFKKKYSFSITVKKNIEKIKLQLMLDGMEGIHVPLLDQESGISGVKPINNKVSWDDYSMEDLKKMKGKRKKRVFT